MDANLNRAREGLRVLEEIARLILEDSKLTSRCQSIRYGLNRAAGYYSETNLLSKRNVRTDPGRPTLRRNSGKHSLYHNVCVANARRIEEGLRVLEEFSRLDSLKKSRNFGLLRFRVYSLEQELARKLSSLHHR